MKIELCTFCDFAQENMGKLTIVGTFDTIVARDYPCIHTQLSMVIRIRFDLWEFGGHDFRIETHDLNGELSMDNINGRIEVKGIGNATAVSHLVFGIGNLKLKAAGVANFVLFIDNKEMLTMPLYLRKAPSQVAA
jgi:hypothetical protein